MKTIGRLAASFDRRLPVVDTMQKPRDEFRLARDVMAVLNGTAPVYEWRAPIPGTKHTTPAMQSAFDRSVLSSLSSVGGAIMLRALAERIGADSNKVYKSLLRLEHQGAVTSTRCGRPGTAVSWTIRTGEQS